MKPKLEKPPCPKCKKPMHLLSTGSRVRTWFCENCTKTVIIDRKDIEKKGDKT